MSLFRAGRAEKVQPRPTLKLEDLKKTVAEFKELAKELNVEIDAVTGKQIMRELAQLLSEGGDQVDLRAAMQRMLATATSHRQKTVKTEPVELFLTGVTLKQDADGMRALGPIGKLLGKKKNDLYVMGAAWDEGGNIRIIHTSTQNLAEGEWRKYGHNGIRLWEGPSEGGLNYRLIVMEDDSQYRKLASRIGQLKEKAGEVGLGTFIQATHPAAPIAWKAADLILEAMKNNQDDRLLSAEGGLTADTCNELKHEKDGKREIAGVGPFAAELRIVASYSKAYADP